MDKIKNYTKFLESRIFENSGSLNEQIKNHINLYSVSDDPYDVAIEIGKKYGWTDIKIEKAIQIIRKIILSNMN